MIAALTRHAKLIFPSAFASELYIEALEEGLLNATDLFLAGDLLRAQKQAEAEHFPLLLLALFLARNEGSLCVRLWSQNGPCAEELSRLLSRNLKHADQKTLVPLLQTELAPLQKNFTRVHEQKDTPLIVRQREGEGWLYFQIYHQARSATGLVLRNLLQNPAQTEISFSSVGDIDFVFRKEPLVLNGNKIIFNKEQCLACLAALNNRFTLISGGPGSGKTTIVLNLLRMLLRSGIPAHEIALAAPTGRASRRMAEALEMAQIKPEGTGGNAQGRIESTTIHRLLKYRSLSKSFYYGSKRPLPCSWLIVDETSMIDLLLLGDLFAAIDLQRTRLVFLGDPDQLPSVDAGAVLNDFMTLALPENRKPSFSFEFLEAASKLFPEHNFSDISGSATGTNAVIILEKSHRSGANIQRLAAWIKHGGIGGKIDELLSQSSSDLAIAYPDPQDRVELLDLSSDYEKKFKAAMERWLESFFPEEYFENLRALNQEHPDSQISRERIGRLLNIFSSARILTLSRRGLSGIEGINRSGHDYFIRELRKRKISASSGLPIMIVKNDHNQNLFNGDTGLLLSFMDGLRYGAFNESDSIRLVPESRLPRYELAFGHTVHKSQGSEYNTVMLCAGNDMEHRLLNRSVIYTGITRARRHVVIAGKPESLVRAAGRSVLRQSGPAFDV